LNLKSKTLEFMRTLAFLRRKIQVFLAEKMEKKLRKKIGKNRPKRSF
jgi:hypothetical protein